MSTDLSNKYAFAALRDKRAEIAQPDRFAEIKADYVQNGPGRSNLRYGYVRNAG